MAIPRLSFGALTPLISAWDDLVAFCQELEALGFDTIWVPDHFKFRQPRFEAWTALAGLACHTRSVRIGTLVTSTAYRNPALFAMQVLTLDHLSRGRLELGLGAGYDPDGADHAAIGLTSWEPPERMQRFREALEIVDRLLHGETVSFAGQYYGVKDSTLAARCLQSPRPPLTIAGYEPSMLSLAARYADTLNTGDLDVQRLVEPRAVFAATRERYARLDEICERLGRDPRSLARSMYRAGRPPAEDPWASVDAFTEFVRRYRELGVSEFMFLCTPWDRERRPLFERIATGVMPSLRAST